MSLSLPTLCGCGRAGPAELWLVPTRADANVVNGKRFAPLYLMELGTEGNAVG